MGKLVEERGRLVVTLRGRGRGAQGAIAPCGHSAMRTESLLKRAAGEAGHLAACVRAGVFTLEEIRADLHVDPQLEAKLIRFAGTLFAGRECLQPSRYRQTDAPRCAEQLGGAVSIRAMVFRRLVAAFFELTVDRPRLIDQFYQKRGGE